MGPRQAESVSNLMPGSKTQCPVCVASFGALGKHIHVVQDHDCGCSLMVTNKHIQCQTWERLSSVGVQCLSSCGVTDKQVKSVTVGASDLMYVVVKLCAHVHKQVLTFQLMCVWDPEVRPHEFLEVMLCFDACCAHVPT